jgi:hypothetical protein
MFDQTSRYFNIETSTLTVETNSGEKKEIKYVRRRFLPPDGEMTILAEHIAKQEDRLDNITALYIGDSTQFWRICDANEVFNPPDLTSEVGRIIKISIPRL